MYTFGFSFYPWKNPQAIADGASILLYIEETADHFGIRQKIQFKQKAVHANWSSQRQKWQVAGANGTTGEQTMVECRFLFMCSGYYDYAQGHEPTFPNSDAFTGPIIHPQKWDTHLDYTDKRIVIIGSGATAITLLPVLAQKAKSVTMLQRSPTYIMNMPSEDGVANFLKKVLPAKVAYQISRWKNILISIGFYQATRKWPDAVKRFLQKNIAETLGDKYEKRHFDPTYNPWDQRLCLVPDNDFFEAIKAGKADIVTDTIKTFTPDGVALESGEQLDADIIVTATGLKVQLMGGMQLSLDGAPVDVAQTHTYKGLMLSDIPNFAVSIGYTNASWTLKSDLNSIFVAKLLNHMQRKQYAVCVPRFDSDKLQTERLLDFDAGYILRAEAILPKQGSKSPWKVYQNYIRDLFLLKYGRVKDAYLEYS
ncbi:MAG TPA: NAD(P)/FAD-dependent oxidoreductase [Anaerolineae bacterium]|nr:NAD(P)/FAD-dependent oxidoreductase [Anaerolineae bacterium]